MRLVDAVIAFARSDVPDAWARHEIIAPRTLAVADAARELLRQARFGGYDSSMNWASGGREVEEASRLQQLFLENFVAAVHAGRCSVRGVPHGGHEAVVIDPVLITVKAFKRIKGDDEWELAGTTFFGVRVAEEPSPGSPSPGPKQLRLASDPQIHAEIKAEYDACEKTGDKPPNVKEIGKPVQARLRKKGLYASLKHIQDLAGDPRYVGLRWAPGRTVASEQRRRKSGKTVASGQS